MRWILPCVLVVLGCDGPAVSDAGADPDSGRRLDAGVGDGGHDAGTDAASVSCVVDGTAYASIQDAIDDANCFRVVLEDRAYAENLTIAREVIIEGTGADSAIAPPSGGVVVRVEQGPVVLRDLTVRDGVAETGAGILSRADLTLEGVTVTGNTSSTPDASGVGIFQSDGQLVLRRSQVRENTVIQSGDGVVHGVGIAAVGSVSVTLREGSSVSANVVQLNGATVEASGGGIYLDGATLDVEDSELSGNQVTVTASGTAIAAGGAIFCGGGGVRLVGATLEGNSVEGTGDIATVWGGTIAAGSCETTLLRSHVRSSVTRAHPTGTQGTASGGALMVEFARLSVTDSDIHGAAHAEDILPPGASHSARGGAVCCVACDVTIERSTLSGECSCDGLVACSATGGVLSVTEGGAVIIRRSTFRDAVLHARSTALATAWGAMLEVIAGVSSRNVVIESSTLSGSETVIEGPLQSNGPITFSALPAGSVQISIVASTLVDHVSATPTLDLVGSTVTMELRHSILADNANGLCRGISGPLIESAGNLYDMASPCHPGAAVEDPELTPLAENGGPTATHALTASSPARDAIDAADCVDVADSPLATDQRGQPRPNPASDCDIGAYELQ